MKIVLIDSGVSPAYIIQHPLNINEYVNLCPDNTTELRDDTGHGTSIAHLIATMNPNVEFVVYRIYQDTLTQEASLLASALEHVLYSGISNAIVHMSLGINYHDMAIEDLCNQIYCRANLLVAAFDNLGAVSFPAAYASVLGVESSDHCIKKDSFRVASPADIVDVYAKGGYHRVFDADGKVNIRQGNSYSAAYVTGFLSKKGLRIFTNSEARSVLAGLQQHCPDVSITKKSSHRSWAIKHGQRYALFPYNKEIINIINFSDMLSYEIRAVYSIKHLGTIGKQITNLNATITYTIENIEEADYSGIDVFVLGHMDQIERYTGKSFKRAILYKCLENHISVYSLDAFDIDDELIARFEREGCCLFVPRLQSGDEMQKNGKLYAMRAPILGVFGTSSKQGKFTLQLRLRQLLIMNGYNIKQLSSEPTGFLYGIEDVAPFGYNSNIQMSGYQFIDIINSKMHALDTYDTELILVGSQSRTTSEAYFHMGQLALRQIEFLIATNPDIVILCVNSHDDTAYIKRTIKTIESLVQAEVVCMALYPFSAKNSWKAGISLPERLSEEESVKHMQRLSTEIGIPCYSMGDHDGIQKMCETAIDALAEERQ